MSDERKNSGHDQLVSDTYQELADDRTPDALNEKVLHMAAREARTRYSIARAWMRPVAWAATIGLSLALVMQLSELPQPEFDVLSEPPQQAAPASAPVEQGLPEAKAEDGRQRKQAPVAAKRSEPAVRQVTRADDSAMDAFEAREMAVVHEAEELARAQAGSDQPPALIAEPAEKQITVANDTTDQPAAADIATVSAFAPRAAIATTASTSESLEEGLCPNSVRETAEKWLECIEDAVENGAPPALVDEEYERLREKFPEFEPPTPNK